MCIRDRDIGTKEDQDAAKSLIDQTGNYKMNKIITRSDMSARIAGYILILQSEKNHDSVERLNLADRITEVEKANNLYLDLDTQRGIVKEQKGLSMRIRKNVK